MLEIPQLLEGRVGYFDICLFAVLKAQVIYFINYTRAYYNLTLS